MSFGNLGVTVSVRTNSRRLPAKALLPIGGNGGPKLLAPILPSSSGGSPYVMVYKRAGDVFTMLSNPSPQPPGATYCVAVWPSAIYTP